MREENSRFSWLARALGTLIVGGYMAEGEGVETAMSHASQMAMDEIEASQLKFMSEGSPADSVFTEEGEPVAQISEEKVKPGSYERLLGSGLGATRPV